MLLLVSPLSCGITCHRTKGTFLRSDTCFWGQACRIAMSDVSNATLRFDFLYKLKPTRMPFLGSCGLSKIPNFACRYPMRRGTFLPACQRKTLVRKPCQASRSMCLPCSKPFPLCTLFLQCHVSLGSQRAAAGWQA
jgi:hypothetical protein